MRFALVITHVSIVVALAGCLADPTVSCADGRVCPAGTVCDEVHRQCVRPDQLTACDDLADRAPCRFGGVDGHCSQGVCLRAGCGDGVAEAGEQCDGADWNDVQSCLDLDFHQPGTLACRDDCTFDVSGCAEFCGDGEVNGDEVCDRDDLGGATCQTLGYYEPAGLTCTSFCTFDVSACLGWCGDGIVNGGETCDGDRPETGSCLDFGFDAGLLGCSPFCTPGLDACARLHWIPESSPLSLHEGVWVADGGDVFVHDDARIAWRTGGSWEVLAVEHGIEGIWGASESDVFVVARSGVIVRYDGASWTRMDTPTSENLYAVWGSGPTDVFAVGDGGVVLHFDGSEWSQQSSGTTALLTGVAGSGPDDVYAVGVGGVVVRYDGTSWSPVTVPSAANFRDVWVANPDDVHVLHSDGLLRYDGASWTQATVGTFMTSVWGTGPRNVFATGSSGIYHYDGTGWTPVYRAVGMPPKAVAGSRPDHVIAVGTSTNLLRYTGAVWRPESHASGWIIGLSRLADGTLAGVGEDGRWFFMSGDTAVEGTIAGAGHLWTVWGTSPTDVWAGGPTGFYHRDAGGWSPVASPSGVLGLWGSGAGDVFATTLTGEVHHFDGDGWTLMISVGLALQGVWGTGPGDVFAVGSGGAIHHYDGSTWTSMASPTGESLHQVWGVSGDHVFAVGSAGTIVHYDGIAWTTQASPTASGLAGVSGTGPHDVFATGGVGVILHYDGEVWSPVRPRVADDIPGGVVAEPGRVFFAGRYGIDELVRTVPWSCTDDEVGLCSDGIDNDCDGLIDEQDPDCSS